jgi:hypothetical protein
MQYQSYLDLELRVPVLYHRCVDTGGFAGNIVTLSAPLGEVVAWMFVRSPQRVTTTSSHGLEPCTSLIALQADSGRCSLDVSLRAPRIKTGLPLQRSADAAPHAPRILRHRAQPHVPCSSGRTSSHFTHPPLHPEAHSRARSW